MVEAANTRESNDPCILRWPRRHPPVSRSPGSSGVLCDVEVEDLTSLVVDDEQDVEDTEGRRETTRTVKKSIAVMTSRWFFRKVLQLCRAPGGLGRFGMQRETVRSETSNPSSTSSPCTLGAPQPRY